MANVFNGNTFYVDTTSDSGTAGSYLDRKRARILGILFFSDATTDTVLIYDKASGSAAAGLLKFSLIAATAKDVRYLDFSETPIVCPNGIWVAITGSPEITIIVDTAGM